MCSRTCAACRTRWARFSSTSSQLTASRYASIGTFESTTMHLPPGSFTTMSGRSRRPSLSRSLSWVRKSQWSSIPASSTTRFNCTSPQRPRTWGARSAVTRLPVSVRSRSCPSATDRSCSPIRDTSRNRRSSSACACVSNFWSVSLIGESFASASSSSELWLRRSASPVAALSRSSHSSWLSSRAETFSPARPSRSRDQSRTAPPPRARPRRRKARPVMGRRRVERGSDGALGRQKNQLPRVRRPTGAECRIRRLRRATGSDATNLQPPSNGRQAAAAAEARKVRVFRRPRRGTSVRSRKIGAPMEDVFAPGGALERALVRSGDGVYEPRAEQAALAAAVERALSTGEHLVAEAGTGVGKSLAYLVPALESGLRVVVATATKALQEQLLEKDVPVAAAAVGRDVDVQVLKGRANYLCRRQLQGFQPILLAEGRDARAWEALERWLATTETGDRAELALEPSEALWAEVAVGPDRCSGRRCPSHSACFSEAARERAAGADLVIVNHALYFAHAASGGGVLPEHDAVVFDEAHRLEESAASWLGGRGAPGRPRRPRP